MTKTIQKQKSFNELIEEALVPQSEQPFSLPSNWKWVKLGGITEIISGSGFPKQYQGQGENPIAFFKVGNIKEADEDGYLKYSINTITEETRSKIKAKLIPENSVVFAKIGEAIRLNKRAILRKPSCIDNNMMAINPYADILDYRFAYLWLRNTDMYQYTQASAIPSIRKSTVENLPFPLPPLETQKQIVAKLESMLGKINEARELISEAKESFQNRRAAILAKAFRGELTDKWREQNPDLESAKDLLKRIQVERKERFKNEKELAKKDKRKAKYNKPEHIEKPIDINAQKLSEIPDSWVYTYLGNITEIVRGASPRPAGDPKYFGGDIPWITVAEITKDNNIYLNSVSNYLTELGQSKSRIVEKNTLMLTNSGATLGVPKITSISGCFNDGSVAFADICFVSKIYLYYFLSSQTFKLRNLNQGAAQPNLNTTIVKNIIVPLPPLKEQEVITKHIEKLIQIEYESEEILSLKDELDCLEKAILSKAFLGEIN